MKKKFLAVLTAIAFLFVVGGAVVLAQSSGLDPAGQSAYAGADKCKVCHPQQYEDYSDRQFNKAWKVLKMRSEDKNPQCLKCHTTGYGKGGFVSEAETPHLASKQCEACHGPGAKHMGNPASVEQKQRLQSSVKQNVCIECHICMKTHRQIKF
ncbi:MAG: cytochrome c family protein [Candidatus Omnitrophica bacterium]|nr:cytochrome c family protein [Candidatus Omnitrophota bacterium]MBU1925382.1 cytochrome c family protein [Candidatus Omnitrophota bacterium]